METPNIIKCPWNLNSYFGRWMYFSWMTNPKLNFISSAKIEDAKVLRLGHVYVLKKKKIEILKIQLVNIAKNMLYIYI